MSDQEYEKAVGDLRAEFARLKAELVQAVHDDVVGVLRAGEFNLSATAIADQVWNRAQKSAVNGETYPVSALVGWTDMHTANIEAGVRAIVEHLGGRVVPGDREGNFSVTFEAADQ